MKFGVVEKIKQVVDCRELISSLGISFNGTNISCLNSSHPDQNPSMAVYQNHAYCFGCQTNLDAIGIVQSIKGFSFQESMEFLSHKYNIYFETEKKLELKNKYSKQEIRKIPQIISEKVVPLQKDFSIKNELYRIVKEIRPTQESLEWFEKRNLSSEIAWKLGCRDITPAIKEIENLIELSGHEKLKENHFINEMGNLWSPILNLIKGKKEYSGLLIPIFNLDGNIHCFRWRFFHHLQRNIKNKEITLKVLGQPSVSPMPTGLYFAKKLIQKEEIYLCEGEPDWLSLNTYFFSKNSLNTKSVIGFCSFSSTWDDEWTNILLDFKKIYICLHDTEKAKKIASQIQDSLFRKCDSKEKKEYWKQNFFEHYFDEKNDINDHLIKNSLNLEKIDFKLKEYINLNDDNLFFLLTPMNILNVLKNPPPVLEFIFPGLLRGIVGSVVSSGGTGKTMWALQACVCISCGLDTLGFGGEIVTGKSILLSGEDPENITAIRLHNFSKLLTEKQMEKLNQNLKIYSISGQNPDIFDSKWFQWVKDISKDSKLVIIDTLRVFHNSEENDSGKMSELIKLLGNISKENNTSILFLHHTNKNSATMSTSSDQQASRGSSVLTDNIKLQINLVTMTQKEAKELDIPDTERKFYVKYVYSKMNYGSPIADRWLKREQGGILKPIDFQKINSPLQKSNEVKNNSKPINFTTRFMRGATENDSL